MVGGRRRTAPRNARNSVSRVRRDMTRILLSSILLFLLQACSGGANGVDDGSGGPGGDEVQLQVAFPHLSFERPVGVYAPPDDSGRLFVVEQAGVVRVFSDDTAAAEVQVFLDIRSLVDSRGNEEGLLGFAFHPDFPENGRFFLDYTATDPDRTVIAQYRVDPADPEGSVPQEAGVILEVSQPYSNHNGGQIAFGPDGYLYVALGDGGSGGDPRGNGQDPSTLLGSILRIDVDRPVDGRAYGIPEDNPFRGNTRGHREEIFAYGLRNPWRFSFDPLTGGLWTGDVGQNRIEEVDLVEPGGNYGWNIMEGSSCYEPSSGCDRSGLTLPVAEYTHESGISITGGFVYRGSRIPSLEGRYVFADFGSGTIWSLDSADPEQPDVQELMSTSLNISSFGVDARGELLLCAFDGKIYRLAGGVLPGLK